MKIYKKVLKAFGGAALYLDKCILRALKVNTGDEVVIEIFEDKIIINKPSVDVKMIEELLNASKKSNNRV